MNQSLPPNLPLSIKNLLVGKSFTADDVGKSDSRGFIFDDCVLKISEANAYNDETVRVMRWFEEIAKLPAPKVLACESDEKFQYLLMSKVSGLMSCDEYYLEHSDELIKVLARALKLLWSADITDCPRTRTIDMELAGAKYRVENNLVDMSDSEPMTFGEGGFKNPEELLHWLEAHKPDFEPVLSHGDFCLPNIFVDGGRITGFIDLGDTGVGDKWRDIALGLRSLRHNLDGTFGGKVYPNINPELLFDELGIEPDWEKIKWYILLDELF